MRYSLKRLVLTVVLTVITTQASAETITGRASVIDADTLQINGLEGIVSKRLSEPYVSGRTGMWTKAKCRATQHAIVGGWTVSPKGFSGLLLGVYKGKKLIPIGRVGTGFPQKLLRWLEPRLKQLETDVSPFSAPIPRKPGRIIHYAKPDLVAGFEMTSWTNDGVIRQASLQEVRERTDKSFRPDWINLPE